MSPDLDSRQLVILWSLFFSIAETYCQLPYLCSCSTMEDFSQSRGDDDLFDDEIFPIEPSPQIEVVTTQVQEISLDTAPVAPQNHISGEASQSSRGRGRGSSG